MVTFMKGHMAEVGRTMPYVEYFRTYYSEWRPSSCKPTTTGSSPTTVCERYMVSGRTSVEPQVLR